MTHTADNGEESVITKEMLGLFVVVGADLILLIVLLAAVGEVAWTAALGVTGLIFAVFGAWAFVRWRRLRDTDAEETDELPLETLKRRYAAGELSEAEFERKVDQLMESDRLTERTQVDERQDTEQAESDERAVETE